MQKTNFKQNFIGFYVRVVCHNKYHITQISGVLFFICLINLVKEIAELTKSYQNEKKETNLWLKLVHGNQKLITEINYVSNGGFQQRELKSIKNQNRRK